MDDGPLFIDLTLSLDRFWLITRINYTFAGMEEMARDKRAPALYPNNEAAGERSGVAGFHDASRGKQKGVAYKVDG